MVINDIYSLSWSHLPHSCNNTQRVLISKRTCKGLAAARAKGQVLGRPKGSHGASRLDGKEGEIKMLLAKKVCKASICDKTSAIASNLMTLTPCPSIKNSPTPSL